jgi:hypothetical protein
MARSEIKMLVLLYSMLSTAVQPTAQSLRVGACVSNLEEEVCSLLKTILSNFIRAQFIVIFFVAQIASTTLHFSCFISQSCLIILIILYEQRYKQHCLL